MKMLPISPRFALLAFVIAFMLVRLTPTPTYTDAYYHFNAAERLASGQGLTDAYLWNYIGARDSLPQPSHLYWMPLTSLTAAAGMTLLNAPGDHAAAQVLLIPMLAITACVGFWLGKRLGGNARHAWLAGLLTLFSGFFVSFWGAIDTFTPYAFVGSLCLLTLGLAVERGRLVWWVLAGVFAGLGHLTRADGMLLLILGVLMAIWLWDRVALSQRTMRIVVLVASYALVMSPWFARNLTISGSPLPLGGTQAIWFRSYDDLFSYPPDASPAQFFADGVGTFIASRWEALTNNLGTFVIVEGLVILTPLMLIGLWVKRRERLLRPFWLYALGLHLAMTFAFPFPGTVIAELVGLGAEGVGLGELCGRIVAGEEVGAVGDDEEVRLVEPVEAGLVAGVGLLGGDEALRTGQPVEHPAARAADDRRRRSGSGLDRHAAGKKPGG